MGRAVGEAELEQFYKGHRIEVSVWLDGDGWFASLFIYYSKGSQNRLVTFAMNDTFKTYDGAIEAGLEAAQKWIDKGKPAIENFMPVAVLKDRRIWAGLLGADIFPLTCRLSPRSMSPISRIVLP